MADFEPRHANFRALGMVVLFGFILGSLIFSRLTYPATAIAVIILATSFGLGFYCLIRLLLTIESNTFRTEETLHRLIRHQDQLTEGMNALNESILLSEEAKSIAFRDKDLQALRQAIEEEIASKDWEAAIYLADQMELKFGAKHEAQMLRQKAQQNRDGERNERLAMAMAKYEDALNSLEWESAENQLKKIQSEFPNSPEVAELPEKMEVAKTARKKWLLQQWDKAVQSNEIDHGIEILRELDKYLTPSEVAAFEESARGVFKAKLHNLGVEFSLLVAEKVWDRALTVAEEIVSEFPNTRMAQEINQGLSNLRAKAAAMKSEKKST